MNEGLQGYPSPQARERQPASPVWRHHRLYTVDLLPPSILITPPDVYQLGVACWGRGGLAHPGGGHGGGGAGFCFIVLSTRPGEVLPSIIFDDNDDTRFGALMTARAGGDAEVNRPGTGGGAHVLARNVHKITAAGGDGGSGQVLSMPFSDKKLLAGGGGGGAGSFYGKGGRGGNALGAVYMAEAGAFCGSAASGGGFGGHGVDSGDCGAAPGGGGACHGHLSHALSEGGRPPVIWQSNKKSQHQGLGGCGGGGTCSAGGQGRIASIHESLSLGAQGGSGINGRGGLGATEQSPAGDGISYPGGDTHDLLALANLRLSGGGGGGGECRF